jgi:hypothetical protein
MPKLSVTSTPTVELALRRDLLLGFLLLHTAGERFDAVGTTLSLSLS